MTFFEAVGELLLFVIDVLKGLPATLRNLLKHGRLREPPPIRAGKPPADDPEPGKQLIGRHGVVVKPLRQAGLIDVDGTTYPAVSDYGAIEAGMAVTVIGWELTSYRVRRRDDGAT